MDYPPLPDQQDNDLVMSSFDEEFQTESQLLNDLPDDNYFNFGNLFDLPKEEPKTQPQLQTPTLKVEQQQPQTPVQRSLKDRVLGGRFTPFQQKFRSQSNDNAHLRVVNSNTTNSLNAPRNSISNTTVVNTPTPPEEFYSDNLLTELNYDMNMDNLSLMYDDSATLASETRTSYDFRTSSEFFDSLPLQYQEDPHTTNKSRFTSSLSNSISNIFKSNNSSAPIATTAANETIAQQNNNGRFFRSINPLFTNRSDGIDTLHELSEATDQLNVDPVDSRVDPAKKKKKTTSSLVSALASARLGFGTKQPRTATDDTVAFEYNDELTKVISMASLNSSSYNFSSSSQPGGLLEPMTDELDLSDVLSFAQAPRHSLSNEVKAEDMLDSDIQLNNANGESSVPEIMIEEPVDDAQKKDSPDYAALFSDMDGKKRTKTPKPAKTSKTLPSFRRIVGGQQQSDEQLEPSPTVMSDDVEKVKAYPPLPEGAELPTAPPQDEPPRRGRKPTLEYDASKQFVCSVCVRRFRRQEHLKRHFRSLHTDEKPFNCELCDKKFSRSDNLTQHLKTHGIGADEDDELEEE